jgi:hypothetical protein
MKRLITRLFAAISLTGLFMPIAMVSAISSNWSVQISSPFSGTGDIAKTRSFNIETKAFSVNAADVMTVNVYQEGVAAPLGTFQDNDTLNGNSWTQPVTVSADGTYIFKSVASNSNGDADKEVSTTVTVDTVVPGVPNYAGKTRSGNSYTLNFTAPSGDVTEVRIYASTSNNFTANSSTQVGTVTVNASQAKTFAYTAPDSTERFFAVQAYDAAGNGSAFASDPNTVVVAGQPEGGRGGGNAVTTAAAATGTNGANGQTQGATTGDNDNNGQVSTDGSASTSTQNGDVLGAQTTGKQSKSTVWYITAGIIALAAAAYYALVTRGGYKRLMRSR